MFVAGIKRIPRLRGSGYLECPNCHEHALQDVIDDMDFLALLSFRMTPVRRRRVLLCQRCGFRRPATVDELKTLNTAGERIRKAWMVPIGLTSVVVLVTLTWLFILGSQNTLPSGFTFLPYSGAPAVPASIDVPALWTTVVIKSASPYYIQSNDTSGQNLSLKFIRDPATTTIVDLVGKYFDDPKGLSTVAYPDQPPKGTCAKVAGESAYFITVNYSASGQNAQLRMYFFVRQHVGYVVYFGGATDPGIKTMNGVAEHVLPTIKFPGNEPLPSPGTTPSPTAAPSATPSATAIASPGAASGAGGSPSASPSSSPSPGLSVNCH